MSRIIQPLRSNFWTGNSPYAAALGLAVALVAGVFATESAQAQKETVLYSFKNGLDGVFPSAGVTRDGAGNLYGTTAYGGAFGWGTVFKLSKGTVKTVVYNFTGKADGALPNSELLRDAAGNLYGTTETGGDLTCNNGVGCGIVFKLSAAGKETVLHSFTEGTTDGGAPVGGLVRDGKGNFYGTTQYGGSIWNSGTVFKLDTAGDETILYSFTGGNGGTDGSGPNGVILDSAGNLYGTTSFGGTFNTWGTVFKVDATGKETVLYSFTGGADGATPLGSMVRDAAGNLYGTTSAGGTGAGTIFKLDPSGKETVLYSFSMLGDGGAPEWAISRDAAGNLYGNTASGGASFDGTTFKFDTAGIETVLATFGGTNGKYPVGGLALDKAGHIYGTTQQGGKFGWGTVFTIVP